MVSFIIPVYNCEAYISQCIASIINQTCSGFEVILVDDGSTDNSAAIIDDYAQKDFRIRAIHVKNGGPSRARNIGIDIARGEWVIFVDADDWIDKDLLSTLSLTDTSPDITFWGFRKISDEGMLLEKCCPKTDKCPTDKKEYFEQLKELVIHRQEYFGYSWNKVYKRSLIEEHNIRFEDGLSIREDEVFALRYCLYAQSIETLSFAPYNYRILTSSLSHDLTPKYRNYYRLAQVEKQILEEYPPSDFVDAFQNKLFHFYIGSIIESLRFDKPEKHKAIAESLRLFDTHRDCIFMPLWVKPLYRFPIKAMRTHIINTAFSIRNKTIQIWKNTIIS